MSTSSILVASSSRIIEGVEAGSNSRMGTEGTS